MSATLLTQPAVTKPAESALPSAIAVPPRNVAVDAYRGLVMLLMMGEVMQFCQSGARLSRQSVLACAGVEPDPRGMGRHEPARHHSARIHISGWRGLPYSIASRVKQRPELQRAASAHAVWRSLLLVALGIFLRSTHSTQTNFTFEDTLTQIGLGYTFAFLLAHLPSARCNG